jgi:hypothetical protein
MGLSRALVHLLVTDAGAGRDDLDISWTKAYGRLNPLPLPYLPCDDNRDDLDLIVEVERETTRGVEQVIVEESKTTPSDVPRLEVVTIREQQEVLGTWRHGEVSLLRCYATNHPTSLSS